MTKFLIFILLSIFSYFGVYLIRRYAERRQILDHPNERSSHVTPTPRGGGLVIVVLVLGAGLWSANQVGWSRGLVYLVCGIVIAWLGWRDDVSSLSTRVRFAVQGLVAAVSIYGLGYFKSVTIPLFDEFDVYIGII